MCFLHGKFFKKQGLLKIIFPVRTLPILTRKIVETNHEVTVNDMFSSTFTVIRLSGSGRPSWIKTSLRLIVTGDPTKIDTYKAATFAVDFQSSPRKVCKIATVHGLSFLDRNEPVNVVWRRVSTKIETADLRRNFFSSFSYLRTGTSDGIYI